MADYDQDLEQASGPPGKPDDEKDDSQETFLVPKSALYGEDLKPGDTETIEIVASFDEEYEVRCTKKGGDEESEEEPPPPPAPHMGAEMMEADA